MSKFLDHIQHKTLLSDGAMGTMLHQAGVELSRCFDELNLTDPATVANIHRQYLEAGAQLIETNTFGANRYKLREFGLENQVVEINQAAVELAKRVVSATFREDVFIGGAVGPLGVWIAPIGRVSEEKAYTAFYEQIETLVNTGANAIILETFSDISEISLAIQASRAVNPDIPIVAQMTFTRDDHTTLGDSPATIAEKLAQTDADVIGVNCSSGPAQLMRLISVVHSVAPDKKLAVHPNAGYPEQVGGRMVYPAAPDYFGEYALAFRDAGVSIIGGCCGTSNEHIHAMRTALDDSTRLHPIHVQVPAAEEVILESPREQPTRLAQKLASGEFFTTVEVAPPRSFTAQRVIATAEMLRDAGIDFLNISDAPLARMRMSPWAVAHLIQQQVDIETVLHFPVRGRNLLRVQGDLLAAHAMNIRNVFVTMGDPAKIGDYPDSFDTHDLVPTGLLKLVQQRFNQGIDQAGHSIGQPTAFTVGAALNLTPKDIQKEIKLTRKKIENGADFFLTQPIFDPQKARHFLTAYENHFDEPFTMPIVAGVLPLYTSRHAEFLHNEVPGIQIPDHLRARMQSVGESEAHSAAKGVKIAGEMLLQLREWVSGAYLMPPFGRYYLAAEVVDFES